MPKTEWRNWLQKEPKPRRRAETKEEKQLRIQRERKMRFEIRRIAQRAIKDLTLIMTQLPGVSEHPEREYARIFRDGKQYTHMIEACYNAYDSNLEGRLCTKESVGILRDALIRAGLGYQKKGQLNTLKARTRAKEELKRKETKDGIPYYTELVAMLDAVALQPTEVLIERNKKLLAIRYQMHTVEAQKRNLDELAQNRE